MKFAQLTGFCLVMAGVFCDGIMAQDRPDPVVRTHQVTDNVYVLYGGNGAGASVGVIVGEDGLVLVDAMRQRTRTQLLDAIGAISDKPVTYVFNTHSDEDHADGNAIFTATGAAVIAQENALFRAYPGTVHFREKLTLMAAGEEIQAFATSSHTPEDALIYLATSNTLFMGDTFTTNWHPTTFARGIEGHRATMALALSIADENTVIVPGHGAVSNRQGLKDYAKNTVTMHSRVIELAKAGKNAEEIAGDKRLNTIKQLFNGENRTNFIPPNRMRRFVDRILSTDMVTTMPMSGTKLNAYIGTYVFEGGAAVTVSSGDRGLIAQRKGEFMVELLPLSATQFHPRGWLDHELQVRFEMTGDTPTAMMLTEGETTTTGQKN